MERTLDIVEEMANTLIAPKVRYPACSKKYDPNENEPSPDEG